MTPADMVDQHHRGTEGRPGRGGIAVDQEAHRYVSHRRALANIRTPLRPSPAKWAQAASCGMRRFSALRLSGVHFGKKADACGELGQINAPPPTSRSPDARTDSRRRLAPGHRRMVFGFVG